jgi:O-antigen ligase
VRPSAWIFIPYIWLFLISSRAISRWLSMTPLDGSVPDPDLSDTSPLDSAVLLGLMILGLFCLGSRAKLTKEVLSRNKYVVLLYLHMVASIAWSNFPFISLRRCVRSIGTLEMVLMVLTEGNVLVAIRALLRRLYLVHIPLSVIAIKYFRNIGVAWGTWDGGEMWVGLALDKNSLGQVALCGGLVATWRALQNWGRQKLARLAPDLVLLGLTLWILRGSKDSYSSTAVSGYIIGVGILCGLQLLRPKAGRAKGLILTGLIGFLIAAPAAYVALAAFDTTPAELLTSAAGRDSTLTGRTGLWQDLLDNGAKKPVLGVGFGAFWVGPIGYAMYPLENWSRTTPGWRPKQGHNGYLDVYVELGDVGVILLLIVIALAFAGALNDLASQFEIGSLRLVLLLSVVLNNLTEASFLKGTHSLWFVFLLVAINVPAQRRQQHAAVPQRCAFAEPVNAY